MNEPVVIETDNGMRIVLVTDNKDLLTVRVQSATGHNRAVAKLTERQGRQVWNTLGCWLAR